MIVAFGIGCGDDGPSHDFSIESIEVIGDGAAPSPARPGGPALEAMPSAAVVPGMPEVQIGHPVLVQMTINSATNVKRLTADVLVLDRVAYGVFDPNAPPPDPDLVDPDDPEGNDGERIRIGQTTIEDVKKGTHDYVASILVPYFEPTTEFDETDPPEEEPALSEIPLVVGEYYLYAELDPEERFDETDETNNSPAANGFATGARVVQLRGDYKEVPNVYIEKVVIDAPLLDLGELSSILLPDPDEEPEPDFCGDRSDPNDPFDEALENLANSWVGVTAWVNASGAYWRDDTPSAIPLVSMSADIIVREKRYPVQFWDGAERAYYSDVEIVDLAPGVAKKTQVDLRLDPSRARALIADLEAVVNSCFDPYPCPRTECVSVPFPPYQICETLESPLCYLPYATAISECLDSEYLTLVESTRIEAGIRAFDESGGRVLVEWDDPPGFAYTNTWPPELDDPDAWPPLEVNLVPPRDIGLAGDVYPSVEPKSLESSYDRAIGGDYVSAGVSFWSGVGIDGDGAFAGVDGRIPVSLFGQTFDLYKVVLDARGLNETLFDNYVDFDVFVPTSLTSRIALKGRYPFPCVGEFAEYKLGGDSCVKDNCFTDNFGNADTCAICRTLEDLKSKDPFMMKKCEECSECKKGCFSYGVAQFFNQDFVFGAIPVTANMGAQALVGLNVTAEFPVCTPNDDPSELTVYAGPFADASASLEAGLGSSKLLAVGAGADVTLINDTFYARASVQDLDHTSNTVSGTLQADVTNTITWPSGDLYWWAGYPCLRVCRSWGIPYPCGVKQCKKTQVFESFEVHEPRVDRLFCAEEENVEVGR